MRRRLYLDNIAKANINHPIVRPTAEDNDEGSLCASCGLHTYFKYCNLLRRTGDIKIYFYYNPFKKEMQCVSNYVSDSVLSSSSMTSGRLGLFSQLTVSGKSLIM